MFVDHFLNPGDFRPVKPAAALQSDRIKPKLGDLVISFNMNVLRFVPITRIKEKPVWPNSQDGWHLC